MVDHDTEDLEIEAQKRGMTMEVYEPTFDDRVEIPDDDDGIDDDSMKVRFSLRKLWMFTGPGFLMSIAYLDPGNIESDLQSGAVAQYKLVWVLLGAHILGLMFQRLAARLAVVSGRDLSEISRFYYPAVPRYALWLMIEAAIIGSDMQEVIGTAIAFYLVSNTKIPLWAGVLITIFDTFTFLFLDKFGFRKLELFFGILITTMAVMFGYEYISQPPDQVLLLQGMFEPWCSHCDQNALLQGVGIIGAVIMPHNLYLHSSLVKSRSVNRTKKKKISEANFYYFVECSIALFCSFLINLFVLGVFGNGMYGKTNQDVYDLCKSKNFTLGHHGANDSTFPHGSDPGANDTALVDIYYGGIFLGCNYGKAAMYIWAIGILASGQSSTMTGTYAGQFVMEGFLNLKWARWKRVLLTRSCAIVPTLFVAVFMHINNFSAMNDFLNALQAIMLPFALIPLLTFASSFAIMQTFRMNKFMRYFVPAISVVVLAINIYSLIAYVNDIAPDADDYWWLYAIIGVVLITYAFFVIYLSLQWLSQQLNRTEGMCCGSLFSIPSFLGTDTPWVKDGSAANPAYDISNSADRPDTLLNGGGYGEPPPAYGNGAHSPQQNDNEGGELKKRGTPDETF